MTLRRILFTLYGTAIGMVCAAVLANAWPLSAVLTAIISIAVVAAFGYFGNRLPTSAEMSNLQVCRHSTFPVRFPWRIDRDWILLALGSSHVAVCCRPCRAGKSPLPQQNENEKSFHNS